MSTIFISHNSADKAWAEKISLWLEGEGHESVYLAFHPEDGTGVGEEWQKDLYRKIRSCSVMVVLWSEDSRESEWCFAEIAQARALGRDVFPLKVGDVDEHPLLYGLQFIDLTQNEDEGFERLRRGLHRVGVDDSFKWDATRPPYPGFLAFDQADAAVYFGREPEIQKTLNLLNQVRWQENSRLVMILGASGSGKSSLVRAGVYPRLVRDPDDWLLLEPFRPRSEPMKELAVVLAGAFEKQGDNRPWRTIEAAISQAPEPGEPLVEMLEDLLRSTAHRDATVVLFIDQLEELLGHPEDHPARPFLRMLRAALLIEESPLLVLGTMRSDSLPTFQQDSSLVELEFESVSLAPLGPGRLKQIIEGPARVADVALEDGLVEELLADTRSGDSLPLLAFTLRELYEKYADDRLLELDEYEDLGRLKGAVKKAAERASEGLDDTQLGNLRHAFLRLVRVGEEGRYLRRTALMSELPEMAHETVEKFVDRRLLISRSGDGDDGSVEVAHEALFRSWDRLRDWLDLDREALLVHHRVEASAALWKKENGGSEYLWRGARLERALSFQKAGGWAWAQSESEELGLAREFLEASVTAQKKEVRASAKQKEKLAEERRRRVKIGIFAVVVSVVGAVLAILLSVRSMRQSRELADTLAKNYWQRALDAAPSDPLLSAQLLGQALAIAEDDQLVRSLHVSHGSNLRYLSLEEILESAGPITGSRFSQDGRKILTWGADGVVRLWVRADGSVAADESSWLLEQEVPRVLEDGQVDPVKGASFGSAEATILVWTDGGTSRLWDVESGRLSSSDAGLHDCKRIREVVWRPGVDQAYVVRVPNRKLEPIELGSRLSGERGSLPEIIHPEIDERSPNIFGAQFDRAGDRVLTWSADGSVRLWNLEDGSEVGCFQHGEVESGVWALGARFDSSEARVLTWGRDGAARLWDVETAGPCGLVPALLDLQHGATVSDAVFAGADDTRIVTWTQDAVGSLWETQTGQQLGAVRGTSTPKARLGLDGRVLVWGQDAAARLWRLSFGAAAGTRLAHSKAVSGTLLDPDETRILSFDWAGVAKLWDAANGSLLKEQLHRTSAGEPDPIRGGTFDSEAARILIWNHSGALHLWNADLERGVRFEPGHAGPVLGASFTSDGKGVLSWSRDGTARLWDAETGRERLPNPLKPGDDQWIEGAAWSESGQGIWTWTDKGDPDEIGRGSGGGLLTFWDLDGNASEFSDDIEGVAFDRERSLLLAWDETGVTRLLDAGSGDPMPVETPIDQGQRIDGALFSATGAILTYSEGGPAILWEEPGGEGISLPHPRLEGVSFSRSGDLVATWSDSSVNLWDLEGGHLRTVESDSIKGALVSPDEMMILTWDGEARTRLWDIATGLPLAVGQAVSCISGAAFDSTGQRVLYWCDDSEREGVGVAGIWEVPGDLDYPSQSVPLELRVRTGRRFDLDTQEEVPLDREAWLAAKSEYSEDAERHLETCEFDGNNVYRRFYEKSSVADTDGR